MSNPNILLNLCQDKAPLEVSSRILSMAGPDTMQSLSRVSSFWKSVANHEGTYQMLCQALHKGTPTSPNQSWSDYYWEHISVPHDFATMEQALEFCHAQIQVQKTKHMTILLQPGDYRVDKSLIINLAASASASGDIQADQDAFSLTITTAASAENNNSEEDMEMEEDDEDGEDEDDDTMIVDPSAQPQPPPQQQPPKIARLIMDTEVANLPLFRVRQGHLRLVNLHLDHFSPVQWDELVQQNVRDENAAIYLSKLKNKPKPMLSLQDVGITSFSGRGIWNRIKATTDIQNSHVVKLW